MQTYSQDTTEDSFDAEMDIHSAAVTGEEADPPVKEKQKNKLKMKNPFKVSKKKKLESLKDELKAAEEKASKKMKLEESELLTDDASKIKILKKGLSMRMSLTSKSLPATPELDKVKKLGMASSLVRKLSLGGIGKPKKVSSSSSQVFSVEDDASMSSTSSNVASPTSMKRHTPDGEDVTYRSISQMSSAGFDESDLRVLKISEGTSSESDRPEIAKIESRIMKNAPRRKAKDEFLAGDVADPVRAEELTPTKSDSPGRTSASTLPFAVSSWKSSDQIKRPIEFPSPDDHVRRRIAWISQPTVGGSEDKEEILEYKITKLDKVSIKLSKGNEIIEKSVDNEVTRQHKLTISKTSDKKFGRESPLLPGIEEDRTESCEQLEDSEDIHLQPESTATTAFGDVITDCLDPVPELSNLSQSTERREHLYKILVIGELGTGKTSIIKRYVHQFFSQHYRATIGVDFALKVLNWDANTVIRLQLWDIAGQERFGNMTRVYYKEAVGAFIVFDVTRVATFDAVVKWKADLDSKVQLPDGSPIPCVLLANKNEAMSVQGLNTRSLYKCDQQKEGLVNTPAKMDEYCKEKGFSGWFDTSAKENINIEEAARTLVNKILLNDKLEHSQDSIDGERFAVDGKGNGTNDSLSTHKTCAC